MAKKDTLSAAERRELRKVRQGKLDAFEERVAEHIEALESAVNETKTEDDRDAQTLRAVIETFRVAMDATFTDPGTATVAAVDALNTNRPKLREVASSDDNEDHAQAAE